MGSFMPSSPAPNPLQPEQVSPTSLMQLALAVKQMKLQESTQQRQEASGRLDMLLKNPQMLMMMDPKMIERDFGALGYKLASPETMHATSQMNDGQGPAGGPTAAAPPQSTPVPTSQIAKLGAATQGSSAGAQSATPPSPEAARRAPGGGVSSGGIVTPGTGELDQMKKQAEDTFSQKYGALAPLYQGAQQQYRADQIKQQHQMEVDQVFSDAAQGDPRAMGRAMMLSGHPVTDADLRAMIFSSSNAVDDKTRTHALDFALGNETPAAKVTRYSDTLKTLMGSSDFMTSLPDPGEAPRVAQSIVDGHGMPDNVRMNMPLSKIVESNKYFMDLMNVGGLSAHDAARSADTRAYGVPYTLSLPDAAQGLTIPQERVGAEKTAAEGGYMRGEAELGRLGVDKSKAEIDMKRIEAQFGTDPNFQHQVTNLVNMARAKMAIDPEMVSKIQDEIATRAGLTKQQVYNWWQWILFPSMAFGPLGTTYTGTPSAALAGEESAGEPGHDPTGVISGENQMVTPAERAAIQRMTRR